MQRAMAKLRQTLQPLGIEPRLEIRELDDKTFRANPPWWTLVSPRHARVQRLPLVMLLV